MLNNFRVYLKLLFYKSKIIFFDFFYSKPKINFKKRRNSEIIHNIKIDRYNYKIFEFNNSRIWTNKNDVAAYITQENILSEASLQYKKFDHINSKNQPLNKNITLENGTTNFLKKYNGSLLSVLSGGASRDNFTHWFTDVIPRIFIFKKKFKLTKIDKVYVPSIKYKYQTESLNLLGISKKKIISSEITKHVSANKIYCTSHPCFHDPSKVKKWSLLSLRKLGSNKVFNNNSKYKNIFIDRDQVKILDQNNLRKFSSYRVLLNEEEIKNYLFSINFFIFKPENYSFDEQIKIIKSANTIVSLYGAAMMMLLFCKKRTNVIEIAPYKAGNEFLNISRILGLNHKKIKLKPVIESKIKQNGLIYCPISKIKKNLKNIRFKNF